MIFCKRLPFLCLFIFILPFILLGCQAVENIVYSYQQKAESIVSPVLDMQEKEPVMNPTGSPPVMNTIGSLVMKPIGSPMINLIGSPVLDMFEKEPVMNLLGKSFDEIKQVLGEPDEQGYSGWLGPHNYMLYRLKEGVIRLFSPDNIENKIAVSIILKPKQEVLGVKAGMLFQEIKDILGAPDLGPELNMDNQYYMEYFFGEINNQMPEVFISFSADRMNGPTNDIFIKWESFEYAQMEILQAAK